MFEHGTLWELETDLGAARLVVKDDRVIRTAPLVEWLLSASTAQLAEQVERLGWRAVALRAATPADCALRIVRDP